MPISEVYNEDNMIGMARYPDKYFELAVVDVPYGIGESGKTNKTRSGLAISKDYGNKDWDKRSPDKTYFAELFRVSKNQIIWGANHFISKIPFDSSCWIVWDKVNGENDFADCELAWTSFKTAVRQIRFKWHGMMQGQSILNGHLNQGRKDLNERRIHPTQKPVVLYKWLLNKYGNGGDKILDTHMGSQSSRIAAYQMGFDYWGWEIDKEYFEAGNKRFKEQTAQLKLL